jgi:hypothetical protein
MAPAFAAPPFLFSTGGVFNGCFTAIARIGTRKWYLRKPFSDRFSFNFRSACALPKTTDTVGATQSHQRGTLYTQSYQANTIEERQHYFSLKVKGEKKTIRGATHDVAPSFHRLRSSHRLGSRLVRLRIVLIAIAIAIAVGTLSLCRKPFIPTLLI